MADGGKLMADGRQSDDGWLMVVGRGPTRRSRSADCYCQLLFTLTPQASLWGFLSFKLLFGAFGADIWACGVCGSLSMPALMWSLLMSLLSLLMSTDDLKCSCHCCCQLLLCWWLVFALVSVRSGLSKLVLVSWRVVVGVHLGWTYIN